MSSSTPDAPRVGLIGLGSMGFGMGESLLRAGLATHGFDIDPQRVERLIALGGQPGTLKEVAGSLDILVVVVVNAAQMQDALYGTDGVAEKLKPGSVVIACPTVAPDVAKALEKRLGDRGVLYLDAPISGGSVKAAAGELSMMVSGHPEAFTAAELALDAMAAEVFHLGDEAGPGSAMKMVNQLLAGVHITAAAEAITFGMTLGIPPARTLEVISKCAGTSWMFENRGPHIVDGDYTPRSAVDIFVKDLGIVTEVARGSHFSSPLAATALQQFVAAASAGYGREDDAAVAKVYARNAGLKLPGDD
jgi:putative dehydrogenase